MQVRYDSVADVLYVAFGEGKPSGTKEVDRGILVTYGEDGRPMAVEILFAKGEQALSETPPVVFELSLKDAVPH